MINKQAQSPVLSETKMTFGGLGIAPKILDAILKLGFIEPTSIQRKAIPVAVEGKDIIGIAQTGTGKTLAFGIPLVQEILKNKKNKALIVLPTRELALQVEETIQKIGRPFGIKTVSLIGGASMYNQICLIRNNPHVVIGTPGRINDLVQQRALNLRDVSILVLDEADRMFDMGFAPQIRKILDVVPKNRQTMLFSATMPDGIVKIASQHMKLPVRVEIARSGTMAEKVDHELFVVKKDQKLPLLKKLLQDYKRTVLVFIRVKHNAKKICYELRDVGVSAAEIHSNRSLGQRKEALEGFKNGRYRVLVATDIAARGIDVTGIELVINFDLPDQAEDYVHRIGRTGRAGMAGKAISFATPDQGKDVREIEKLVRIQLNITKTPDLPPARKLDMSDAGDRDSRSFSRRPHGGHGGGAPRPTHGASSSSRP